MIPHPSWRSLTACCGSPANRESPLAEAFTTTYDHAESCIRQAMLNFDPARIAAMLDDLEEIRIAFRPG